MTTTRVVIMMSDLTEEAEVGALAEAFARVSAYISRQKERRKDVALYMPLRNNLDGSAISVALGPKATARLLRGESIRYRDGINLRAEGKRTIKKPPRPQIVLAALADRKMLAILDEINGLEAVFVVPWTWEEASGWIDKWKPEVVQKA